MKPSFSRILLCLLVLFIAGWSLTEESLQSADAAFQLPADEQIVGGRNATPGEFPWQAYLEIAQNSLCGGSLISEQWVMTAAHCVMIDGVLQTDVTVILGEHQRSQPDNTEVSRQASSVIPHPQYDDRTADNDIALIKLNGPVTFTRAIAPISLVNSPADDHLVTVGTLATVSGWGALQENGAIADILQTVSVPIVSNATCNTAYAGEITNNMLCAGYLNGGKDSCQGDSGGPLVVPSGASWKQAGIVSFGRGCARPRRYGVYTRVSRYINWINSHLNSPIATATPSATATATPWPEASTNYLRNGDFEAGPNGEWAESSNHYGGIGGLILKAPALGPGIVPFGQYAVRLGGVDGEQGSLSQNVTLPPGSGARLRFSYRLLSAENQCGDDRVLIRVNNSTVAVINLCQAQQNTDWQAAVYDLSAYVGQSFTLQFTISSDDQSISRFVIDNLTLRTDNNNSNPHPTATLDAGGLPNGDFEAGANGNWYEQVGPTSQPGTLIVNAQQAPVGAGLHTGNYVAWLGRESLTSTAILSQTFALPNDPPVSLLYNYQVRSFDTCHGGTIIQRAPDLLTIDVYSSDSFLPGTTHALCQLTQTEHWQQWRSLDVSALAGRKITLRFSVTQDQFAPSALFLDNFTIASARAPQIRLAATTFDFYATATSSQPAPQRLSVFSGVGNTWTATAPTAHWLTVKSISSSLPPGLDLVVNPAIAGQGVHTTTFQVESGKQSVPVQARLFVGPEGLTQTDPAPLHLQAQASVTGIRLFWHPTDKLSVVRYRVLRRQNNEPLIPVGQQIELTFYDPLGVVVQTGQRYCYQVEAVDKAGATIAVSNEACAAAGELRLWAPSVTAKLGEPIGVPINLENADGLRVVQGQFTVQYHPEVLRYQSFSSVLPANHYLIQVTPQANNRLLVAISATNAADPPQFAGPGTLLTLRFATLSEGYPKSDIALQPTTDASTWLARNSNGNYHLPVGFRGGVVTVQAAPRYQRGDTNGDGTITSADGAWLLALVTEELAMAASRQTAQATALSTLSGAEQQSALMAGDDNGNYQLDAGDAVRVLHYTRSTTWPSSAADLVVGQTATPVTMTLALVDNTLAAPGIATTRLHGNRLVALAGGEAVLLYDPRVVEYVSNVESLLPGTEVRFADNQRGQLTLAWVNHPPAQGDLDLLQLTFQLRSNTGQPASPLLLAAARLYNDQGYDLVRSARAVTLARQHGWIGALAVDQALFLPLIQR